MKPFKSFIVALVVLGVFANFAMAIDSIHVKPTYTLKVTGQGYINPATFQFEIRIKHTNPDSTVFLYAGAQYFFNFNNTIANGGTLSYGYVSGAGDSSDLPVTFRPRNPLIFDNGNGTSQLRLAVNTFPGPGNGYLIPPGATNGIKVCKMKLATTAGSFSGGPQDIQLQWRDSLPNPFSKVFAYTGLNNLVNTEITNRAWHSIDPFTGINNPNSTVNEIPKEFALSQNYPNPFNPSTKIQFAIPVQGMVTLKVFDLTGREIANLVNEVKAAGNYDVDFNGANVASGVYFYRINVSGDKKYEAVKRMVLIK
jgi:hypothetical protein